MLRVLEDALIKSATHDMTVRARTPVALYILNQKRAHLRDLERRFGVADPGRGRRHADRRQRPRARARRTRLRRQRRRARPKRATPATARRRPTARNSWSRRTPEAVEEEEATEAEPAADEFEAEAGRGEGEPAAAGEGEPNRPRRRRRRRRGGERGERPAGEGFGAEAPQPTDDGLAAMAEIGGDFAVPTRGEGEAAEDEERAPSARRRRGRRGRRGGGDRERFGAPAPTSDMTPIEGEAEPNLFGEGGPADRRRAGDGAADR